MNTFSYVIISALVIKFLLDIIADGLNLRALRHRVPTKLEGVYRPEEYQKSQDYLRSRTRFGFAISSFSLVVLLIFWFSGGFNFLAQLVRSWELGAILSGLIFISIILIAYQFLMLPFSIYATFVIEEHFGFNRSTPRLFVMDRLKGLVLTLLLGGTLLSGILALFTYAGNYAWLYCWLAVTLFQFFLQFIAPVWIMPLFNKFTPLEPGQLRDAIESYARSAGNRISNIFVIDSSKRSTKSNAFFTGFGRTKRIALFDTLIEKHSVPELVAILAHEIGHHKKGHVLQGMVISILHTGLIFYLLSVLLNNPGLYQAFYMQAPSLYAGLVFFGLLYTPVEMLLSIALNAFSRRNEYEADRFATETTEEPEDFKGALKNLAADNLANLTPHPFYVFLNYSHPTLLGRLSAIKKQAG
ncbi:M48 family metallopeptidase [Chloroflexota bacterium]